MDIRTRTTTVIGSRASRLAVIQSELVMKELLRVFPWQEMSIETMTTEGDRMLDGPLDQAGGKGLFVKELEQALSEGKVDLTVHSLKDMTMDVPADTPIAAYSRREDPRDVLILPEGCDKPDLSRPIGTSSLRRAIQIKKLYPDAEIAHVRGNVETRLRKLDEGRYSALVLAAAGVKRLGLAHRISRYFSIEEMVPASCQGILGIQCRAEDAAEISAISDRSAELSALAERAFVREIGADCGSPDTAYSYIEGEVMHIRGFRYDEYRGEAVTECISGPLTDPEELGRRLARRLLALTDDGKEDGKVWLVGAGPGDPGLMTVKGREVLADADTVVTDALVGPGVLSMIPAGAEVIYAGKRAGHHTLSQDQINELLLDKALEGRRVVRLKGGDPFLFGRGGEELELLCRYGVPYEIVPGITSAVAVPAYAGIPVTHRDFCSGVHIITGHRRKDHTYDIDFEGLVKSGGTIIFLMGISSLPVLMDGLMGAGMDPHTPAAVIEKGTTADQRIISSDVAGLQAAAEEQGAGMPAVIVVGEVTKLAADFAWRHDLPLSGIRAVVTRPRELGSVLSEKLRAKGAEVIELPAISIEPLKNTSKIDKAIEDIAKGAYNWLVLTSPSGVRVFFDMLMRSHDIRILAGCRIACLGSGTEKELAKYGLRADFVPDEYSGRALGRGLAGLLKPRERVLIARASIGNEELMAELLKMRGIEIDDIATYDTVIARSEWFDPEKVFDGPDTYAMFTSASTVKGFVSIARGMDFTEINAVCIGHMTAREAENHGMKVHIAEQATLDALVDALEEIGGRDE